MIKKYIIGVSEVEVFFLSLLIFFFVFDFGFIDMKLQESKLVMYLQELQYTPVITTPDITSFRL